jgi:hypothetical protein
MKTITSNGTDDTAQIQAALDGGDSVVISGKCLVSQIKLHDSQQLNGSGGILQQLPTYKGHMITLADPTARDWHIQNLKLQGTWTGGEPTYSTAININFETDGNTHRGVIQNVTVDRFGGNGIVLDKTPGTGGAGDNLISGCQVYGCALHGFVINVDDCNLTQCISGQNMKDGYKITGWATHMHNSKAYMGPVGFEFSNTQGNLCIGLEFQKTNDGPHQIAFLWNGVDTDIPTLEAMTTSRFQALMSQ